MNKKILPFTLLLIIPFIIQAYPVSIRGSVVNKSHQLLPGVTILIYSAGNDGFQVDTTVTSDIDGNFLLQLQVPDTVVRGTLFLSVEGCDQRKRINYHQQHQQHAVVLTECQRDGACGVRIVSEKMDNGQFLLETIIEGTGPFNFLWNTGDTTGSIMVDGDATYWVSLTSPAGCSARDVIHLRNDKACETRVALIPASNSTGSYALLAKTRGKSPFSYLWSTGDTTRSITDLVPGEYCVQVVDALGCESRACFFVPDAHCSTEIHAVRTGLNSGDSALYLLTRTKGHPPYLYAWSTGDTTRGISVKEAGEYCVKVTDALGCTTDACIKIESIDYCKTQVVLTPGTAGANGQFGLQARSHGRSPFTYKWNTGDTSKIIKVFDLQEYCVEVTDANGCLSTDCIDLSLLADQCEVNIKRSGSGSLIAQTRGHGPFSFIWNTGDTSRLLRIDSTGEYCVQVTNAFGCTAEACIVVSPNADRCQLKIHKRPLSDQAGYQLIAKVNSDARVEFIWNTGETTQSILVTQVGEYCVEVISDQCPATSCLQVDFLEGVAFTDQAIDHMIRPVLPAQAVKMMASPNPVSDILQLSWELPGGIAAERLIMRDISGQPVMIRNLEWNQSQDLALDLQSLLPGWYVIELIGKNLHHQVRIVKTP